MRLLSVLALDGVAPHDWEGEPSEWAGRLLVARRAAVYEGLVPDHHELIHRWIPFGVPSKPQYSINFGLGRFPDQREISQVQDQFRNEITTIKGRCVNDLELIPVLSALRVELVDELRRTAEIVEWTVEWMRKAFITLFSSLPAEDSFVVCANASITALLQYAWDGGPEEISETQVTSSNADPLPLEEHAAETLMRYFASEQNGSFERLAHLLRPSFRTGSRFYAIEAYPEIVVATYRAKRRYLLSLQDRAVHLLVRLRACEDTVSAIRMGDPLPKSFSPLHLEREEEEFEGVPAWVQYKKGADRLRWLRPNASEFGRVLLKLQKMASESNHSISDSDLIKIVPQFFEFEHMLSKEKIENGIKNGGKDPDLNERQTNPVARYCWGKVRGKFGVTPR